MSAYYLLVKKNINNHVNIIVAVVLLFPIFLVGYVDNLLFNGKLSLLQYLYVFGSQISWIGLISITVLLPFILFSLFPSILYITFTVTMVFLLSMLFVADLMVFDIYKFHINGVLISLFFSGGDEVFDISYKTYIHLIVKSGCITILVFLLNNVINKLNYNKFILSVWILILSISQILHAYKNAEYSVELSQYNGIWPLYYPLTARGILYDLGLIDEKVFYSDRFSENKLHNQSLNYPKRPVKYSDNDDYKNVLLIVIDSWRFSDFTKEVTPNIYSFSKKSLNYINHFSGGNSTQAGIFSLFYSIPPTYWSSFHDAQVSPILIDSFLEKGFHMGIYSSASLTSPPLARTVFKKINHLELKAEGESSSERDRKITDNMIDFIGRNKSNSYFGFLFYDSAHAYDFPSNYALKFEPSLSRVNHVDINNDFDKEPYHNRYLNSLHFIDGLISEVISEVNLENTMVIITSDHGEEFNDNGLNYWGHSSNYSDSQIHVPMIIYNPSLHSGVIDKETTHYDISPTILMNVLNVLTPIENYSVGGDLFGNYKSRNWFISGSYHNYAIRSGNKVMVINPLGDTHVMNSNLEELQDDKFPKEYLIEAVHEIKTFYKD
ncbi:sulfatase-like hydrolase/transferase [Vibrio cidicii]|uniref:sulfatase-like hydrolase/transferase n=2 Tax=Vibrio cidicii TaxID=1763883 RepID=UPI003704482C